MKILISILITLTCLTCLCGQNKFDTTDCVDNLLVKFSKASIKDPKSRDIRLDFILIIIDTIKIVEVDQLQIYSYLDNDENIEFVRRQLQKCKKYLKNLQKCITNKTVISLDYKISGPMGLVGDIYGIDREMIEYILDGYKKRGYNVVDPLNNIVGTNTEHYPPGW